LKGEIRFIIISIGLQSQKIQTNHSSGGRRAERSQGLVEEQIQQGENSRIPEFQNARMPEFQIVFVEEL
jgi:hypothetical protein